MNQQESAELVRLLTQLQSEKLLSPHMPLEVWKALQGVVPQPAVEVVLTTTGKNFYLTYRKDAHWDAWHIPGGFMQYKESIPDACLRVGRKELGIDVHFEKLIDAFMWPNHPFASPLSLVCVCSTKQEPKGGEFFTEIPKMISNQDKFIEAFLAS